MIGALITLLIYVIVLALLWWVINYVLDSFPLPEPANKLIRVGVVILIVIIVVVLLIDLFAGGSGVSLPRLRLGVL